MPDIVICEAVRTPIGRFQGGLSTVRPDDLLAHVFKAVVDRTGIDPADLEEVFAGCANQAGEDNRNVARMSALLAGFPQEVAGVTVTGCVRVAWRPSTRPSGPRNVGTANSSLRVAWSP